MKTEAPQAKDPQCTERQERVRHLLGLRLGKVALLEKTLFSLAAKKRDTAAIEQLLLDTQLSIFDLEESAFADNICSISEWHGFLQEGQKNSAKHLSFMFPSGLTPEVPASPVSSSLVKDPIIREGPEQVLSWLAI